MILSKYNLKLKIVSMVCIVSLVFVCLAGCQTSSTTGPDNNIVILYTSDVHCAVDNNIGYDGLAAYRDEIKTQTPYVSLVDCGDFTYGQPIGNFTKGHAIVDIMNAVGYDYFTLGNHDFDWGMQNVKEIIDESNATALGCNIMYRGSGDNLLSGIKPYEIKTFGNKKVGFVGVSTPQTALYAPKNRFVEDGKLAYDFNGTMSHGEETAPVFYDNIQKSVDDCKVAGADYIVLMAHLGDTSKFSPFSSVEVIQNTNNIDVVLDGHAHNVVNRTDVQNKDGKNVPLSAVGTEFANIGNLTIKPDNTIETTLISQYDKKDATITNLMSTKKQNVAEEVQQYQDYVNTELGYSDYNLSDKDENGVKMIKCRETTIGNFCADAIRDMYKSDIALVAAGEICSGIDQGTVTVKDCQKVFPYEATTPMCEIKATGEDIVKFLEVASSKTCSEYKEGDKPIGENAGFVQVSGIKYTIDTSVPTGVTRNKFNTVTNISAPYRVKDVMVMNSSGEYEPIDPTKTYTVAGIESTLLNGENGNIVLENSECIKADGTAGSKALINYTKLLEDDFSEYASTEGRITVK